jgi:hypothetical protein
VPKNNMFKIGVATAAAAVGAILALTSVFAHTAPSTNGRSVVGSIANAAHAASFPLVANDPALNVLSNEQITDEEEAAEAAAEPDEDAAEVEDADNHKTEQKTEHHDDGDHESD